MALPFLYMTIHYNNKAIFLQTAAKNTPNPVFYGTTHLLEKWL